MICKSGGGGVIPLYVNNNYGSEVDRTAPHAAVIVIYNCDDFCHLVKISNMTLTPLRWVSLVFNMSTYLHIYFPKRLRIGSWRYPLFIAAE